MRAEIVCVSFLWPTEHLMQDIALSKFNEERRKEGQRYRGGREERRESGLGLWILFFSLDLGQLPLVVPVTSATRDGVPLATPNGLGPDPLLSETVADG